MPRYRFYTLDVFTDRPFGGNPLAVVLDADALSGERMQAIAAEFNLSETVFVLKPAKAGGDRKRLRIFTPRAELPFAGHPTVGAGYLHERAPRDGSRRWLIEQGFEMGRPSLIDLEADVAGGRIMAVRVGGCSVLMSAGWLDAG